MIHLEELSDALRRVLGPVVPDPPLPAGTPAAVIVPLVRAEEPTLLFTRRTELVRDHKGEISFPGGVRHEEDPDLVSTALRETEEELGIQRRSFDVVGSLAPVQTFVSGYVIAPFVGVLSGHPSMRPSPVEIEEVLEFGVGELAEAERQILPDDPPGLPPMYVYEVEGHTVWGATGRIVHGFVDALRRSGWLREED
jgi:8-oxo-dGTP pyrophosphatase MutT (NUDIX family)